MSDAHETFKDLVEELRKAVGSNTRAAVCLRSEVAFRKLLGCRDSRAAQLVVGVLHGEHGPDAGRLAWRTIQEGAPLHHHLHVSSATARFSLAALSMIRGTVDTFEAVVLAGAPESVPTELKPRTQAEWMDLVSSTDKERAALKLELTARPNMVLTGAVGEIAAFADFNPSSAQEALELVWRLDPHHPGFDEVAKEPSKAGAAVRAFLMSKRMAQTAQELPAVEAVAARRRRISI